MSEKISHSSNSGRFVTGYHKEEEAFSRLHHKRIHEFVITCIKEPSLPDDQFNQKNIEQAVIANFPALSDSQAYGRLFKDIVLSILCSRN